MTNKPFSRRTKFVSQKRWLYKAGSRENTKIFLRGDTLRKWCITRPVGRVRIETDLQPQGVPGHHASPGRLAGCGLKQSRLIARVLQFRHHPAGWPGAD